MPRYNRPKAKTKFILVPMIGSLLTACNDGPSVPEERPSSLTLEMVGDTVVNTSIHDSLRVHVRVTRKAGVPVGGVSVHFVAEVGGGSASPDSVTTDKEGVAKAWWRLGGTPGDHVLRVVVPRQAGLSRVVRATTTLPYGSLQFQVERIGNGDDADGFTVAIAMRHVQISSPIVLVDSLTPGSYVAVLSGVAPHCYSPASTFEVTVARGQTTQITLPFECYGGVAFSEYESDANYHLYYLGEKGTLTRLTERTGMHGIDGWTRDGRHILIIMALDGQSDLYMVNPNGTDMKRLTNHPWYEVEADLSPDGRSIVFARREPSFDLFNRPSWIVVMDWETGEERVLSRPTDLDSSPTWSPDGSEILFTCWRPTPGTICQMRRDGSNRRVVHRGKAAQRARWSPRGTEFAFLELADKQSVLLADTLGAVTDATPTAYGVLYKWAPAGAELAVSVFDGSRFWIEAVNVAEMKRRVIYGPQAAESDWTDWSADGQKLAIAARINGARRILVVNRDGTGARPITPSELIVIKPTWSPAARPGSGTLGGMAVIGKMTPQSMLKIRTPFCTRDTIQVPFHQSC